MIENELRSIEKTYQQIYLYCQESLYYSSAENQKSSQQIISATTYLLTDATSIIRKGLTYGPQTKLNLNMLQCLLSDILKIMTGTEEIREKEDKIKALLEKEKVHSDTLLTIPDWSGCFVEKVQY